MESLETIFSKYNTDKNKHNHNYSRQYEQLLLPYRDKSINFLEIGVLRGESIKMFSEVFPKVKNLVGLDVNPACKQYETQKIKIEIGNSGNPEVVKNLNEKYGPFDIIIDDGSHINRDVIKSFEMLFPLLNDNGLYIIEDTVCYKHANYIDKMYPNHLDYFHSYVPFLNQWRYDSTSGIKDNCVDPFKIQKKTDNVFEYSIDRIEYGCSYIAVSKKIRTHWINT